MFKSLSIVFLFISFASVSQTLWNTSVPSAQFITGGVNVTFADQPSCVADKVKLYYYYRADETDSSGFLYWVDTYTATSSVKVWEFDSKTDADADYTTTTPIFSGTSSAPSTARVTVSHALAESKIYLLEVIIDSCSAHMLIWNEEPSFDWASNDWKGDECIGCITGFRPQAGNYVLSAWVKDGDAPLGTVSYSQPSIQVTSNSVTVYCVPTGEIIDGWQRIETELYIGDENPQIDLVCGEDGDCYFDDIRIFPKDASMVTYVYDPITLRLMAELDERNYAKIYEYDEQGKLIRVKKETEMGVMTIQENRENNSKE